MSKYGARASRPPTRQEAGETPAVHNGPYWHSRGYLPHFESGDVLQHITFRLHDAVPSKVLAQWKAELSLAGADGQVPSDDQRMIELARRVEQYEDKGHGECWLRNPVIASIVEGGLLQFDSERYRLVDWCIMPNHVHVLVQFLEPWLMSGVLHSWKSWMAKECNKALGRKGTFWMEEYFDRYVRSDEHCRYIVDYIAANPVKAGLAASPEAWRFSRSGRDYGARASRPPTCQAAGGTPALHKETPALHTHTEERTAHGNNEL